MKHINITDEKQCCGCSACSAACPKQCITLKGDKLGFRYPVVDTDKCINCGLCVRVCPFINPYESTEQKGCYAAVNIDEDDRLNSSSGGIFIVLARKTIENGGVVFGATFNDDWSVSHHSASTLEEVIPMMKSKYLQSQMDDCFSRSKRFLESGREVLFTGTPCQIAGLKHFLRKDYPNLLTVEVICHGVPSPAVWHKFLEELSDRLAQSRDENIKSLPIISNKSKTEIMRISFRDKRLGWKRSGFALDAVCDHDTHSPRHTIHDYFEPFGQNRYMQAFLRNWSLRPSCFKCKAKAGNSHSDITVGDFWGIENWPELADDDRGTSCVICHTERGRERLSDLPGIALQLTQYTKILSSNPVLETSVTETDKAIHFRKLITTNSFHTTMAKLEHVPLWKRIMCGIHHRLHLISSKFHTK